MLHNMYKKGVKKMKKKLAIVILCIMMLCLTACGKSISSGKYNGSSGQSAFEFNKDGTCTYTEYGTDTYQGTWEKKDSGQYEIKIDGEDIILYGAVQDSGDIIVTANSSEWITETFSKE